jgi:hypothetical protein
VREQPQAIETETELTEGAERANTAMEQSIKKQSRETTVKTRKVSAKPSLKPIRKKSKKKKKRK